jgi:hypothetical protein
MFRTCDRICPATSHACSMSNHAKLAAVICERWQRRGRNARPTWRRRRKLSKTERPQPTDLTMEEKLSSRMTISEASCDPRVRGSLGDRDRAAASRAAPVSVPNLPPHCPDAHLRKIRARDAHGQPHVRLPERRRVVGPAADHGHHLRPASGPGRLRPSRLARTQSPPAE